MDPILYSNYRELTAAIVLQACRDYIHARKYITKHDIHKIERAVDRAWANYIMAIERGCAEEELIPIRTAYFTKKKQWTRYYNMVDIIDSIEKDFEHSYLSHYLTLLDLDITCETIINSLVSRGNRISTVIDGFTYKNERSKDGTRE